MALTLRDSLFSLFALLAQGSYSLDFFRLERGEFSTDERTDDTSELASELLLFFLRPELMLVLAIWLVF